MSQLEQTEDMTAADFRKILRRWCFVDRKSKVKGVKSTTNWLEHNFEVLTSHSSNIGNLIEIERRYGLVLLYVKPIGTGNLFAVFGKGVKRSG